MMPPNEAADEFNIFEVIATAGGAFLTFVAVLVVFWRIARPHVQQLIRDTRTTKHQVANSHHTNLRDDLTLIAERLDEHCRESHEAMNKIRHNEQRIAALERRRWFR